MFTDRYELCSHNTFLGTHTPLRGKPHIALDKILDQIKTVQNQADIRKEWEKNTLIICQRLLNNLSVIISVSVFAKC